MATLASSCDSCIEAKIPHCADLYQVCGVLTADTEYTSVITDRFGKKHILTDVTDADGIWTIDPADYPDGFFSQHGGPKVLQFYTDQNLCDLVTISIGDPAVDYTCISLKVFEVSEAQGTWDVLCQCAAPTSYIHAMFISGNNYDVFNDTYDSLTVDGVTYSAGGGSLLSTSNGGDTITPLLLDATDAGLVNATNDVGYYGDDAPNFTNSNYIFVFVTDSPKVISLNVTLNGTPTTLLVPSAPLNLVTYCATANAADATGSNFVFKAKAEDGAYYQFLNPQPFALLSDTVILTAQLNAYFNTNSRLIGYESNYTDNGDGTYSETIKAPDTLLYPDSVQGVDIGVLNYTPCP